MNDIRIINGRTRKPHIKPRAALAFGKLPKEHGGADALYCILTVGPAVTRLSDRSFLDGDPATGTEISTDADQELFSFEEELLKRIIKICHDKGYGIRKRLEPGTDLPLSIVRTAFQMTDAGRTLHMRLTSGDMLDPIKSECLIFELCENAEEYNIKHDCASCTAVSCEFRS